MYVYLGYFDRDAIHSVKLTTYESNETSLMFHSIRTKTRFIKWGASSWIEISIKVRYFVIHHCIGRWNNPL